MVSWRTFRLSSNKKLSYLAALMIGISLMFIQSPAQGDGNVPDLITDRPTRAANTATVLPGYVLWETGFKFSRNYTDGDQSNEIDFLDSVFRIGLANKAEKGFSNLYEAPVICKNDRICHRELL